MTSTPEPTASRPASSASHADEGEVVTDHSRCPDDGACHHECAAHDCFRVRYCGPLSGVFPGDVWPVGLVETVVPGPDSGHL